MEGAMGGTGATKEIEKLAGAPKGTPACKVTVDIVIAADLTCGSSSVGRASAFQAEGRGFESRLPLTTAYIAQAVEHFLGKEEVTSSSLVVGSGEVSW